MLLRSGGALGADSAFYDSLSAPEHFSQIFVTSKVSRCNYFNPQIIYGQSFDSLYRQAMRLIMDNRLHKKWENCSQVALDLHNRNVFQVLGLDLQTPSEFVLCWTPNGEKTYAETGPLTGGTGTAINTAAINNIPVFNLANEVDFIFTLEFILKNIHCVDFQKIYSVVPKSKVVEQLPYGEQLHVVARDLNYKISCSGLVIDAHLLPCIFPEM